ncbi:LOC496282 protein, related [Eimeria tenella]|uniref:LOC496282 protein, related n=1 Tax=Eimeria tenella TaxID=5802 RepID=U6KZE6_EIMTE|nr:LOC496282 protein, related [Eimeria tenella]CDJ42303.1 LOC496282 protein, related [Eimeria tenella]|eukprot:XP_013233053.1 LOC496282 protein, related [Eimeria tenella]
MMPEGDNPTPQVQRPQDTFPRCRFTSDFYSILRPHRFCGKTAGGLFHQRRETGRPPPPQLPRICPLLSNRDLRWQQQQVKELLLEERVLLLADSQIMTSDAPLAAYSYEHESQCQRSAAPSCAVDAEAAAPTATQQKTTKSELPHAELEVTSAAGANPKLPSRTSGSPADLVQASTSSCAGTSKERLKPECRSSSSSCINRKDSKSSSCSKNNMVQRIDRRRAAMFSRNEMLTAQDVYSAVRCITDPEHPYTLEELMVVTPEYVKVHCCNNYSTSSTGERGSSIYSGMLPQQQHLHHWVQTRGLHLEINFRPTIPHCSQATLIGLLLLVKAQRAAAAAAKAETAAVEVSIIAGSHSSFASINKQLKDKERVRAAAANPSLKQMVDTGLKGTDVWEDVT